MMYGSKLIRTQTTTTIVRRFSALPRTGRGANVKAATATSSTWRATTTNLSPQAAAMRMMSSAAAHIKQQQHLLKQQQQRQFSLYVNNLQDSKECWQRQQQRGIFYDNSNNNTTVQEAHVVRETNNRHLFYKDNGNKDDNNDTDNFRSLQEALVAEQEQWIEQAQKELHDALQQYEQLLKSSSSSSSLKPLSKEWHERVNVLHKIVAANETLSQWQKALRIEQVLLEEYYQNEDDDDDDENHNDNELILLQAACLYRQGKLHMRQDALIQANQLYRTSLDYYESALSKATDAAKTTTIRTEMCHVMISMAGVHFHRDRLEDSLQTLKQAQELLLEESSSHSAAAAAGVLIKCLEHQGLLYRNMEDFPSALEVYQRAYQVYGESLEPSSLEGKEEIKNSLQLDMADMLAAVGQHEDAIAVYEEILSRLQQQQPSSATEEDDDDDKNEKFQLQKRSAHDLFQAVLHHSIGKLYSVRAAETAKHHDDDNNPHLPLALEHLSQCLAIKRKWLGETHTELIKTLNVLGATHAVFGGVNSSSNSDDDASSEPITTEWNDRQERQQQHKETALKYFQQALLAARVSAAAATGHTTNTGVGGDGQTPGREGGSGQEIHQDPEVMLTLRNIALLKGEKVPKMGK